MKKCTVDFTLREYTKEEYEADMKKILEEKGLYRAVKEIGDQINEDASDLSYLLHRDIQEKLCDILNLIKLDMKSREEELK